MKIKPILAPVLLLGLLLLSNISLAQDPLYNWSIHRSMEENSVFKGVLWASIGPAFMGGRIESIEIQPDNPAVMYIGMGSGGLWKTSNGGLTWERLFSYQASFSIGDLAISQSDTDILWLGTGEQLRASRGYTYSGSGVYQSKDGGKTWINKGLTQTHQIGRVVVDPIDPNKVLVAAIGHFWAKTGQRGLFYTEDAGNTWKNILNPGDSIGVSDVVWDSNNQTIYACTWQMPKGTGSAVYQSEDLGKTWQKLDLPFDHPENTGRLGITASKSWPNILYLVRDNRTEHSGDETGIIGAEVYKSDDFGISWKKTHSEPLINYAGFGWAFGDITVHPDNPNEIFLGGVHLLHSSDGGNTFNKIRGKVHHLVPNRATDLHLDQHDLKILGGSSETWVLGNDGGLFISHDRGKNWLHINNIPTGEFYDIEVNGSGENILTGGTQDNSNVIGKIDPYDFDGPWNQWDYIWLDPWSGGDGFTAIMDPTNPDWIYWESQNGHLNKKNLQTGENVFIKPAPDEDEAPLRNSWFTPYLISQFDQNTIYYAANKVYKSINKGESWTRASHDLTFTEQETKKSRSITRMAISPIKPGIIYAGTEKGALWVTRNDGIKWHEVSNGLPDKKVVGILASQHSLSRVYVVLKAMDQNDPNPYVFVSEDFGNRWVDISANLPNVPLNCILEDKKLENLLIIGTDAGVLLSQDQGKNWEAMSYKMPTTSVVELRWMAGGDFLLAATHGQGLFYCHFDPIRKFRQSGYINEPQFLGSVSGQLPNQKDYSRDWDYYSTHPLVISWLSTQKGEVQIRLLDGPTVKYSTWVEAEKGINQFSWDLILSREEDHTNYPLPEVIFPKAGNYKIEINLNPGIISGDIRILSPEI